MPLGASRLNFISKTFEAEAGVRDTITMSFVGNAQINTQESQFGGSSLRTDTTFSTPSGITTPAPTTDSNVQALTDLSSSSSDGTWECFIYITNLNYWDDENRSTLMGAKWLNDSANKWTFGPTRNGKLRFTYGDGASDYVEESTAMSVNTWYHVALVKKGGTFYLKRGGSNVASVTPSTLPAYDSSIPFSLGARWRLTGPGFIEEVRVSDNDRYGTGSYTVPTSAFVNDSNTKLLLHLDGQNGDTSTSDSVAVRVPVNVDRVFGGELDTAQYKFGTASWYNDSNGDGLKISDEGPFDVITASSEFTLEMWVRRQTNTSSDTCYLWFGNNQFALYYDESANRLKYETEGITRITSTGSLNTNTWYHVAIVRDTSYNVKMYIDGTQSGSTYTNDDRNWANCIEHLIGISKDAGDSFVGHIDEVRVSNTQRYTTTFTPSASAFTNDSDTICLFHFDGTDATTVITDDAD